MAESEIQEAIKELEKDIRWLQENVAPDDIYLFCQQNLSAAAFFLSRWSACVDMQEECDKDPRVCALVMSTIKIHENQRLNKKSKFTVSSKFMGGE